MMALEILAAMEKKYKIQVPEDKLNKLTNLKETIKLAKEYVSEFKKQYDSLFNLIHPSNTLSMKLVEILKAEFRWGENGEFNSPITEEPFILFLI